MSEEKLKYRDWTPTDSNQIRLRHLRQICARCIRRDPPASDADECKFYYTLHITMMSAPFYTSEYLSGENIDWSDIDCRKFPENIVTASSGVVVRLWAKDEDIHSVPELVTAWGVYFSGLLYLGSQCPKESALFLDNSLIFGTSWGYFVSEVSLTTLLPQPIQTTSHTPSSSYSIPTMCRIHRMQRAIYKEGAESDRLRQEIQLVQSNPIRYRSKSLRAVPSLISTSPGDQQLLQDLRAKRQVAIARVSLLIQERTKQSRNIDQLKETLKHLRVDNHTRALHLKEKQFHLQMDKDRLSSMVKNAAGTEDLLIRAKQQLTHRRRQLFHEISEIFPIVQVKEDVYSINDVILPNSDSLTGCDDTRLSVALGHVSHLVQMISIFLQVPNRYPLSVWSSRSRIVDQVSQRELDSQKEFPLYPKNKDRLYFEYAVYLLNKNIAQLRWICGLNTTDLAATLPNLSSLVQHLLLVPREPAEDRRTKRTSSENQDKCSIGHRSIASNAASAGHPIKSKWSHHHRGSRSLAGSRMSLNTLPDQSLNWSVSLDQLTDSPLTGGYFKHLPSHQQWMSSSSTMSLDLAVDRLRFCTSSPLFCPLSNQRSALQHHSSAPDLRSAESPASSPITQHREEETLGKSQVVEQLPTKKMESAALLSPVLMVSSDPVEDYMFVDDVMSSVSARTEALANAASSFKLRGRGRHPSHSHV